MDEKLLELFRTIVSGDDNAVSRMLAEEPGLATALLQRGAARYGASNYFFDAIKHHAYAGDTALHLAAAAFNHRLAKLLLKAGASCDARNRRGAEPLHYAAETNHWNPSAQHKTIDALIAAGADPNSLDKSKTAPLHRAVRTRSSAAVQALLAGGAQVRQKNANGSTPLHLAVQNTGRGGSGSEESRAEQTKIIALLLAAGARATDTDVKGHTVRDVARTASIRELLPGRA